MNIKRKLMMLGCTLATCVTMGATPAFAETVEYNWNFSSTAENKETTKGYKNDNEQNYYLTITIGNVTSSNVFGTRIRRSADGAFMSNYVIHKTYMKSKSLPYTSTAKMSTYYHMRGKKDSSSTTAHELHVNGKITY